MGAIREWTYLAYVARFFGMLFGDVGVVPRQLTGGRVAAALVLLQAIRWGLRQDPPQDGFVCVCVLAFAGVLMSF
jgi:hypothetical protein